MEEYRTFAALVFIQIITWGIWGCFRHYSEKYDLDARRLNAPKWLRRLFGDFRHEGTLDFRAIIIHISCYITILIGLLFLLRSGLTRDIIVYLFFLQLLIIGIVIFLIEDIIPRLFK